jgi:hypothetical protein
MVATVAELLTHLLLFYICMVTSYAVIVRIKQLALLVRDIVYLSLNFSKTKESQAGRAGFQEQYLKRHEQAIAELRLINPCII